MIDAIQRTMGLQQFSLLTAAECDALADISHAGMMKGRVYTGESATGAADYRRQALGAGGLGLSIMTPAQFLELRLVRTIAVWWPRLERDNAIGRLFKEPHPPLTWAVLARSLVSPDA